ncbi:F0F1 ATP synthase subunit delta [Carnimonas bestiolae]|uniref:F0F1 ATP synthase subunit delta n=1 Tax=Carnimonas bestiolae TaxID=3402172 RepID=UPI003EDC4C08
MAQSSPATVARPYAKAAFDAALEDKALDSWSQTLALLEALVKEPKVSAYINDPRHSEKQLTETIVSLCGDQLEPKAVNFVTLLAEHHRLPALDQIRAQFEAARDAHERRVEVEVVSAFALSDEQQRKLAEALKKRLDREISITTSVDDSLLGGVIIRAGDTVIDGSLRGRLSQLESSLNV